MVRALLKVEGYWRRLETRADSVTIHAGEPDATDIHPTLDLESDLLVHMLHAESDHLRRVAEREVLVTGGPRANLVLGVGRPPVRELLDHTTVALETDDVLLNAPSMFREMTYTKRGSDTTAREVLQMATTAGADAVGVDCGVIEPGKRAALVVIDGGSDDLVGTDDPARVVVRSATVLDVEAVVL